MPDEIHKLQKDPPEGSRQVIDHELSRPDGGDSANHRETGARKLEPGWGKRPDPTDTGDKADRPRKPYGLTEPNDDRGDATRHHDGRDISSGKTGAR
jgi:hypothetical protein